MKPLAAFLAAVGSALGSIHPAPPPPPPPPPAAPKSWADEATRGAVALEGIAFALRHALAAKGSGHEDDPALPAAVLEAAAGLIPGGAALDEAAQVAAVVVPALIALRRAHPMANPVVEAQTAHAAPWWR